MKKYAIAWKLGQESLHLNHLDISTGPNGNPTVGIPEGIEYINSITDASMYLKKATTVFPNHDIEIVEL